MTTKTLRELEEFFEREIVLPEAAFANSIADLNNGIEPGYLDPEEERSLRQDGNLR